MTDVKQKDCSQFKWTNELTPEYFTVIDNIYAAVGRGGNFGATYLSASNTYTDDEKDILRSCFSQGHAEDLCILRSGDHCNPPVAPVSLSEEPAEEPAEEELTLSSMKEALCEHPALSGWYYPAWNTFCGFEDNNPANQSGGFTWEWGMGMGPGDMGPGDGTRYETRGRYIIMCRSYTECTRSFH